MEILYFIIPIGIVVLLFILFMNKKETVKNAARRTKNLLPVDMSNDPLVFHYVTPSGVPVHSSVEYSTADKSLCFGVIDDAIAALIEASATEATGKNWTECRKHSDFDVTTIKAQAAGLDNGEPCLMTTSGIKTAGTVLGVGDLAANLPDIKTSILVAFNTTHPAFLFEAIANEGEHFLLWKNTGHIREFFADTGKYFWFYIGENDSHPIFPRSRSYSGKDAQMRGFASGGKPESGNCLNHLVK